jgi:hypothetical protein
MRRLGSLVFLTFILTRSAAAVEVSVSPILGASVLDQTGPGDSHGALRAEVTLGRTFLAGAGLAFESARGGLLAFEVLYGPYHGDAYHYCISDGRGCEITPVSGYSTAHTLLLGLQYTHPLTPKPPQVFAGLGAGIKVYSYEGDAIPIDQETTAWTLQGALGVEFAGKAPFRIEARGVWIPNSPYLLSGRDYGQSKGQFELQFLARLRVRLPH